MPYVSVWVDDAELSEFDDSDLIEELEKRGYACNKGMATVEGVDRIKHLLDCGLISYARDEALRMLELQLCRPGVLIPLEPH